MNSHCSPSTIVLRTMVMAFVALTMGHALSIGQERSGAAESAPSIPENEKPFWQNAQAFVDAYAKKDATAIGNLFTSDAEFYDEYGAMTVGREAIVKSFQDVFEATPDATVEEIAIDNVRMIGDSVAIEEGRVATRESEGGARETNRYLAIYLKEKDGVWRINTLKDFSLEKRSARENLEDDLSWLLGQWITEDRSSVVRLDCDWSEDGNFLLAKFTVQAADGSVLSGEQRIGWDPVRKQIRSWVFDSEGGYLEGSWSRSGEQWLVKSEGYNSDGQPVSIATVYTIHDAERVSWQYHNLIVGNEVQDVMKPVVMVRRPPSPEGEASQ